jgi:hypothetical protein
MMILNRRLAFIGVFAGFATLALAGCGDTATGPFVPTASSLNGDWQRTLQVPGNSERWLLTLTGTSIAAGGSWSGEACCGGTVTGSGSVAGDSIHLDLNFFDGTTTTGTPRFTEHVDAAQTTMDDIEGTATRAGVAAPIHMQRTMSFTLSAAPGS